HESLRRTNQRRSHHRQGRRLPGMEGDAVPMNSKRSAVSVAVLILAAVAAILASWWIHHRTRATLVEEHRSLQVQVDELVQENQRNSNLGAQPIRTQSGIADQRQDLLTLRGEVARLQNDSRELAQSNAIAKR